MKAVQQCAQRLIEHKMTIAFAESATAGRLAFEFSLIKDAGLFLKGGFICYDACLKEDILKVPHHLVEQFSPESYKVTKAITLGVKKLIPADLHIGVTGLPAPGGSENPKKPVGTMFIYALHNQFVVFNEKILFKGKPEEIILKTVKSIALRLNRYLDTFSVKKA